MELQVKYYDLPLESACCHEDWKVRMIGYQRAFELFLHIEDKNSSQWDGFIEIIKRFVVDENPTCHIKGLLATLIFVNKCGRAAQTTKDVVAGIVNSCLGSEQSCIISLAAEIIFSYIKIGQHEVVNTELTSAVAKSTNAKKVATCLFLIREAIQLFGVSAAELKRLIRLTASLYRAESKEIRNEATKLFQHFTIIAKPDIIETTTIASHQLTVLEGSYKTRTLDLCGGPQSFYSQNKCVLEDADNDADIWSFERSQQTSVIDYQDIGSTEIFNTEVCLSGNEPNHVQIENASLILRMSHDKRYVKLDKNLESYIENPLNFLEKFKKEFYIQESNFEKWSELERSVQSILFKLKEENNCSEWIDSLIYMANQNFPLDICCTNIKCITLCANTLKTDFEPYIPKTMHVLFRKFEEKETHLTNYVRECIDSIFECTNLEKLQITLSSIYTKNRHPVVKLEINSFMVRCFLKSKNDLKKSYMKTYYNNLTMDLDNQHFNIRNSAVEALGIAMKLIDLKSLEPYLFHVKEFMLNKIKKYAENVKIPSCHEITTNEECNGCSNGNLEVESKISLISSKVSTESLENVNDSEKGNEVGFDYTEEDYIDTSDLELDDYELSSSVEYTDDVSLRLRYWSDDLEEASGSVFDEENSPNSSYPSGNQEKFKEDTSFCIRKSSDNDNDDENNDPVKDLEEKYWILKDGKEMDTYAKRQTRNFGKYSDNEENISRLVYPSCESQINYEYADETFGKKQDVWNTAVSGIVRTSRMSGNDAREQLMRNLCRKYNFDPDRKPMDIEYFKDIESKRSKTQFCMSDGLLRSLSDKDLSIRRRSLERLQSMVKCTVSPIDSSSPSLKKASEAIAERISDCSLEICLSAVHLIESLITSMGPTSEQYIDAFFPPVLRAMGDPRPGVRQAALSCIKKWEEICAIENFFRFSIVEAAGRKSSLAQRLELWKWVGATLAEVPLQSVPEKELTSCLKICYQHLSDTDYQVNESILASLLGFIRHLQSKDLLIACKRNGKLEHIVRTVIENKRGIIP